MSTDPAQRHTVTTSFGLTVIVELDEPLRVVSMTGGPIAVSRVRVTVHDDGSGDEDGTRVTAFVTGVGYRSDGSVGKAPRKGIVELDALPRELVRVADAAYRHELARLSTVASFPADSPVRAAAEVARRRHTDDEPLAR